MSRWWVISWVGLFGAAALAGCGSDAAGSHAGSTTSAPDSATAPSPGTEGGEGAPVAGTYLSLGDSYAQGYQPVFGEEEPDYREGYAYLVPELAAAKGYDLDLVNLGCGGANVESFAEAPGCAVPARAPGGPVYDESQLDAGLAYLADHPGEVELITLSIGGNDITACGRGGADPIGCVTDAVARVDAALAEILPELRAAAGPDTLIVGLTYPDVILGSYLDGEPASIELAELSVVAFEQIINPMLRERYEAVGGIFVDVTEATEGYVPLTETTTLEPYGELPTAVAEVCRLTWFCELTDIHPKAAGYAEIADLVVAAIPEA